MKQLLSFFFLFTSTLLSAQVNRNSDLYKALYTQDSLLFNVGFNTCDISQFEKLVSANVEFYHDQSGVMTSKEAFIASIRDGLCKMDYQARRELVEESLQVFPLYNNGKLYGAIQMGEHRFYALYSGQPEKLTSTAKFTHLWQLEDDGEWRLSRVLSYDHQSPK